MMKIPGQTPPTTRPLGTSSPENIQANIAAPERVATTMTEAGLKPGDIVMAKVISLTQNAHATATQTLLLQINQTLLEVNSNILLTKGDLIEVKVRDDLTISMRPTTQLTNEPVNLLNRLIAKLMPYQANLTEGINLALKAGHASQTSVKLSDPQKEIIQRLQQALPYPEKQKAAITTAVEKILQQPLPNKISEAIQAMKSNPRNPDVERLMKTVAGVSVQTAGQKILHLDSKQISQPISQALKEFVNQPIEELVKQILTATKAQINASAKPTNAAQSIIINQTDPIAKNLSGGSPSPISNNEKVIDLLKMLVKSDTSFSSQNIKTVTERAPTAQPNQAAGPTPANTQPEEAAIKKALIDLLNTKTVKNQLNNSGHFLESSVLSANRNQSPPLLTNDLKAILVELATSLAPSTIKTGTYVSQPEKIPVAFSEDLLAKPFEFPKFSSNKQSTSSNIKMAELTTGELLKQIAATINRIQFNQLNSLYQSQSNTTDTTLAQHWLIEVPILVKDDRLENIQVKLERHQEKDNTGKPRKALQKQWKITLGFDFIELGPMQIQVSWAANKVSSVFWAERSSTLKQLENERTHFREQLKALGLDVENIECRRGKITLKEASVEHNLVDIRT